jgi:hypothetical protein
MQLQQSGLSGFGYSPSASTAASGSNSGGTSQATARKLLLGSVWSALGLSGPPGGVQDIASALSSALSTGLASGQDLAPQLSQTVDNALGQVSQQLEAQGVSPDHVAKLVARFRQDLADAVNSAAATAANGGSATRVNATTNGSASGATTGVSTSSSANTATSATATAGVGASSSNANSLATSLSVLATVRESETLTIQTTDGAQVTLRFRARGAELGTSQTQADGSTATAGALFASGKFQVEVSGNLSSADLAAINNIVSQVNSLATQFFSGDVQDAFAAAASIGADPSEIAGFSLQMSYSATLYQQASAAAAPSTTNTVAPVVTDPTTTDQAGATSTPYVIKTPSNWHTWSGTPATSTLPTSLAAALNAAAANATATAGVGATATGPGSSNATASAANSGVTANAAAPANASASTTGTGPGSSAANRSATNASTTAAAADTNGTSTSAATTSTPAGTTPAAAAPAATATPQQTIANFLQNALARLGGPSNGPGATLSARWGIQLLAVALPAYAQAQTATGSQAIINPISASPPSAAGNGSPAVTQVAVTAPTQAAHLAAATLIQLIN